MTRVQGIGLAVDPPPGWEVAIDTGAGRPDWVGGSGVLATVMMPRMHVANFALPAQRGDFGSGAVDGMTSGDVFICVLEEESAMASTRLYLSSTVPRFTVDDFDPNRMQRPRKGQSGAQAFFHIGDRAFVIYVALGDHLRRAEVIEQVNRVLSSLEFV